MKNNVQIPDVKLRKAIEKKLGKRDGAQINEDEMLSLTELNVVEAGVRNLTGLESAKNLSTLRCGGNSVSDLSPLKELKKLQWLDFWGNRVSSL